MHDYYEHLFLCSGTLHEVSQLCVCRLSARHLRPFVPQLERAHRRNRTFDHTTLQNSVTGAAVIFSDEEFRYLSAEITCILFVHVRLKGSFWSLFGNLPRKPLRRCWHRLFCSICAPLKHISQRSRNSQP